MNTVKFKTNINCGGCLATVKPFLDQLPAAQWEVDLQHPDRILTVKAESLNTNEIAKKVKEAGYSIEKL